MAVFSARPRARVTSAPAAAAARAVAVLVVLAVFPTASFAAGGGRVFTLWQGRAQHIASLPGGVLLVVNRARVLSLAEDGQVRTAAGTGAAGFSGDGGPATRARITASAITALPDGGFLIAGGRRVRRVSRTGVISTVAGTGGAFAPVGGELPLLGDLGPATAVPIGDLYAIAALPGGGFAMSTDAGGNELVREVSASGTLSTIVGV